MDHSYMYYMYIYLFIYQSFTLDENKDRSVLYTPPKSNVSTIVCYITF